MTNEYFAGVMLIFLAQWMKLVTFFKKFTTRTVFRSEFQTSISVNSVKFVWTDCHVECLSLFLEMKPRDPTCILKIVPVQPDHE